MALTGWACKADSVMSRWRIASREPARPEFADPAVALSGPLRASRGCPSA